MTLGPRNDTPAFMAVRDQLAGALRQLPYQFLQMSDGDYLAKPHDIPVLYRVLPDDADRPLVLIQAFVLSDVEFTPALLEWVATEGQWNLRFSAAAMTTGDGQGVVVFSQSMDVSGVNADTMLEFTEVILDHALAEMETLRGLCGGVAMRESP